MTQIDDSLITQNICKPTFVSVRLPYGIGQDYRPPTDRATYNDAADLNSPQVAMLRKRVEMEASLLRPPTNSKLKFNPAPVGHTNELIASIALLDDINVISDVGINQRIKENGTIEADPLTEGAPKIELTKTQLHLKMHIMAFKQLLTNCYRLSEPGSVFKIGGHKCAILTSTRKFLGNLYHEGSRILSLDSYKKAMPVSELPPATSQELHSFASCVRYALCFIPNLSAMMAKIDSYISQHPVGKIKWDQHPSLQKAFTATSRACRELCCLDSLPSYPSHIEYLILSSDANDSSFGGMLASKSKSENKIRLHQLLSCRLPEAVQNLHIYLKEMYSLVALINQVEDVLKMYKGVPIKAVVDNSALFISLSKLAKNGQLSAHSKILERDKINLYLSRLYQAIATYKIDIFLAGTKTHLADYVSRSPVEWEKEILITPNSWETQWKVKDGPPCTKCSLHELEDLQHPEYCDKKIKDIPDTNKPNILQVMPSLPKKVTCEGKSISYRTGGVKIGKPMKVDFHAIFNAVFPLPQAKEEHMLARQPLYPSDSEQLVFLMKNLDMGVTTRAEQLFSKPTSSTARVANLTGAQSQRINHITIHPRITLFWGSSPLVLPPSSNIMVSLFLSTEAPKPKDLKNWPRELQEAKALSRPRFSRRISEPTPLTSNVSLVIACYGARAVNQHFAPLELMVPLMRQVVAASIRHRCRKVIIDGELVKNAFNLGRRQITIILCALWNELEELGTGFVKCEVYFSQSQAGDSTTREMILKWPLFVQGQYTAEKIGEVSATIHPRGIEWREMLNQIQQNLKRHLQSNYEVYIERKWHRTLIPYIRPKYVHILTIDLIKVVPKHRNNLRCANLSCVLPPEVEANKDKADLAIHQHCDPFISKIIQGALEKKISGGTPWIIKKVEFKMVDHVLMGRDISKGNEERFKPVLPTMRMLPELIQSHYKVNHRGYRFCIENLSNRFFYKQGITTPQDIVGLSRLISKTCMLCLHRTMNHEPKLYYQTRKVALSLNLPSCCTLSHDVMYLQGPREFSQPMSIKYVSIMVCNTCNYVSAKPLVNNSSEEIAKHLLEVIQESGRIPSLLLSDSGAAQSLGDVEKTISNLRNLVQIRNNKIIRKSNSLLDKGDTNENQNIHPSLMDELSYQTNIQPNSTPRDEDITPLNKHSPPKNSNAPPILPEDNWGPPQHLTPKQIEKLMDEQSWLYRQPLSSGPPARKKSIPSSLGLVDIHCRLLGEYLRKEWSPHISKTKLATRIISYVLYNNYMHKHAKTGYKPAELHLSRSTYLGNNSIFSLISGEAPITSPQIGDLKEALEQAHRINQAQKTILETGAKDMARNEKKHGTLSPDSEFLETYPRLGLVLVLTHRTEKLSKTPNYVGPALILARQVLDRNLFLLDLTSGHILKRSYRQVKPYLPPDFLNLPEDTRDTLQAIFPLGIVNQGSDIPIMGKGLSIGEQPIDKKQQELSTVLSNILKVFKLIKDSLPDLDPDTPYVVNLAEEEDEEDDIVPPKEVHFDTTPLEDPKPPPTSLEEPNPPPSRPQRTITKPARFRD